MRIDRFKRVAWVALAAAAAFGCGGGDALVVPTAVVEPARFEMRIRATGELQSARATTLELPRSLRGMQRVAWLADEGAVVREGEVVCELDADPIAREMEQLRNRMAKVDSKIRAKREQLNKERKQLEGQLSLLEHERDDAIATAPKDESIFSRHTIIEAKIDLELIETKLAHTQEQLERAKDKARTEMEILSSERKTSSTRLEQLQEAREQLIVRAPHDGFFLPGRTWQGEKVRVGMELMGGRPIGQLPDLSEMEATLHVLEAEAAGLATDLETEISIDAHPGLTVAGTVKQVQPVANPLDRQSPVKYFDIVVKLEQTDPERMRPGGQVTATIFVKREENVLSVPNQAIFVEAGEPWVYVRNGGSRFERRAVKLGERSLSRTVIAEGLQSGDRVALVDPLGQAEEPEESSEG